MRRNQIIIRVVATLAVITAGAFLLHKYEYLQNFNQVDNIVGMLPVALVLSCALGASVLIWSSHTKKRLPVTSVIALIVVLSAALFPTALRGNWWINPTVPSESEAAPDLSVYAPFAEQSIAAKLDGEPALTITDKPPVLDGAIALYPLYSAFAQAVYDSSAFNAENISELVLCTNTPNAYKALISGERDIIFAAGASKSQQAYADAAGVTLRHIPIGREAFVFLVGADNPVDNLTIQQLRNIYSGKTANWATLGWKDGGRIIAFQRPEVSGSQTGLLSFFHDLVIQAPQPIPAELIGTNSLMKQVSVVWRGVQPALGYSYRFFAASMYANPDTKLLSVNGTYPSPQNIQNGSYPFTGDFYAVTKGEPAGAVKAFIDWILSPQGQELVEKTGYAKLIN